MTKASTSLHCPHCSTPLRIRDRSMIGRRVPCPDCRGTLVIVADGPRGLAVEHPDAGSDGNKQLAAPPPGRSRRGTNRTSPGSAVEQALPAAGHADAAAAGRKRLWNSPVAVAWTIAGALAVAFGAIVLFGGGPEDAPNEGEPAASGSSAENSAARGGGAANRNGRDVIPPVHGDGADERDPLAGLLPHGRRLAEMVGEYVEETGRFPPGTASAGSLPPGKRFSWLALLAADRRPDGVPVPLWDQGWQDPLNDPFVRRRIAAFQNPLLDEPLGEDGYPAAHFAGVAGVGADAPLLPPGHPRAGIFGYDRPTRPEDVTDGLANTIMIAGVTGRPGSWAAGGPSTIRSFTREPYVNGPDGFGSGLADRMFVLMADGSVREISRDVPPTIVRRLAAMSDGLPLDVNVPGEPGDALPKNVRPPTDPKAPSADPSSVPPRPEERDDSPPVAAVRPPVVPREERPEPIDVEAALAQPIVRFELTRRVPLKAVLSEVEEMAGVPVRWDRERLGTAAARLDQPVTLTLEKTTLGEILEAALKQAELTFEIKPNGIEVRTP